jgi:hypothetical protein
MEGKIVNIDQLSTVGRSGFSDLPNIYEIMNLPI